MNQEPSVRRVLMQATNIVSDELDRLNSEIRSKDEEIKKIEIVLDNERYNIKYWQELANIERSAKNAEIEKSFFSVFCMICAMIVAFVFFGLSVYLL